MSADTVQKPGFLRLLFPKSWSIFAILVIQFAIIGNVFVFSNYYGGNLFGTRSAQTVVWQNPIPGTHDHEQDVHDGTIVQWEHGGKYYWYGMAYTDCKIIESNARGAFEWGLNKFISTFFDNCNCAPMFFQTNGFGNVHIKKYFI